MSALRAAELETLFTANTDDITRADKLIKSTGDRIEKNPLKVNADAKDALAGMDRVEQAAKKLVSSNTAIKLDADISRAEVGLERAKQRLADLEVRALGGLDVTADVRRAEASLQRVERSLDGLRTAKTLIEVDANTTGVDEALDGIKGKGRKAGDETGDELGDGLIAALASIPIAGALAGIAYTAAKAVREGFQNGLKIEAGFDRLAALTGIDEESALRLGRAAGEAYADNFGESIEKNMDTARLALQFDILDPDATTRDAQKVVEGLAGIASVLGEDVEPVARAVTQMLRTGVAKTAQEAFDIIATGAREGVNIGGDLLDTFDEYSTQFRKLGLTGPAALGLISQGLRAGARDSDIAADALKEFAVRTSDPSMVAGFDAVGFSWEDLNRRVAQGGPDAARALDETLDRIRAMPDPAQQAAAAVALFGTQSEDMAAALLGMDLTTAVDQLNGVTGAAQTMFDTLADNDASKIETAQRNIEVAAQGIQGALAAAFSEPIGDFATFVSENRGPVMQFLLDLANGALDFGDSMVEGLASSMEAVGDFVSGPLADLAEGLGAVIGIFDHDAGDGLKDFAKNMRTFDDTADAAADTMREKVGGALDDARERLNKFADPVVALAFLNDASLRLATAVEKVGVAADGTKTSISDINVAALDSTDSGKLLAQQIYDTKAALEAQIDAAGKAGESEDDLAARRDAGRQALEDQLTAMGLTQEQVETLIGLYDSVKPSVETTFLAQTEDAVGRVAYLKQLIDGLHDKHITIVTQRPDGTPLTDQQLASQFGIGGGYDGGVVEFYGRGGISGLPGLVPMDRIAQVVSPNTWRVVGDRGDVPEAYIPLDGSARSMAILLEAMRRFGLLPMADGGIVSGGPDRASTAGVGAHIQQINHFPPGLDVPEYVRASRADLNDLLR